ncbi:medium chain dehydrogenase/reductase family protein [Dyadobacter chenwenxiniae]|uniref:Medium chain dehydrogenase/reductase family protein n=1 Tax=Dyadobacter chenwenxiniae TaxID=2906456 RepID=A0A9X1PMV4_9BACT|nr:medium chain dehydrogenase/reductase family protein [Dyadobacter chenwenxiniae]MCF0063214.1 medium chain dehydrogenase/reductase family protein [Dyadobacter chenwenxiniae]UON85406.1 medium chain dehydrogenase/reductase family protein [Dyadobacter chenwenxiniae]
MESLTENGNRITGNTVNHQNVQSLEQTRFNTTEVIMPGIVEPEGLLVKTRVLNDPAAGQVSVKVEASGICFAEQSMRRGRYYEQPKFPFVPGYDLVGTVVATGPGVDTTLLGKRVAALTKTGGWASYTLLPASDLLPVPEDIDPLEAETLIVNGITAWQMLHVKARIKRGQTILVHGANGGVGTILTQLALYAGVRVIGTASPRHHEALRAQGVQPVDYNDTDLAGSVLKHSPGGVDAVFDHVGGASFARSFGLLTKGGVLVCYAIASALNDTGNILIPFLKVLVQLGWWNILPNGRKAYFYNIWDGKGSETFQIQLRETFTQLTTLLASGVLKPQIAARFPLAQITAAMKLAESRTAYGKVVLVP